MANIYKVLILSALCLSSAYAQNVLTGGYDAQRTNANLNETTLSPNAFDPSSFGKLFTLPVDGQVYAQPLYESNVAIAGQGVHNAIFVATAHNSVFAFDADAAGAPLWQRNLGPSVRSSTFDDPVDGPYTDITPEIGILGTPVIDPSTGTLYVVAASAENGTYYYRLHALDITSGVERFGAPVAITAQVNGTAADGNGGVLAFSPLQVLQRPALLLSNGIVYVAFGSHADLFPWHGWMMGYSASNVQLQTAVFTATANGWGGAIWQSGRGPAVDSQGNIYVVTSNGDSDNITDYSNAVLKLDPASLAVLDWFAPSDQQMIDEDDDDLGSAGAIPMPGTNFLLTGGKQGTLYLLNTASLGHMSLTNTQIPQSFSAVNFGIFNMALWDRSGGAVFYTAGQGLPFSAWRFSGNTFDTTPVSSTSSTYGIPYQGMTITANGRRPGSGILWVTTPDSWPPPVTATLHAFNADNLSDELWNSSINPNDALGGFSKFANPTVANGKVYVPGASGQLTVYGILPPPPPAPVITGLVNAASYASGPVAPGEIVAVYGQNLGPETLAAGTFDQNGNLGVELGGSQVTFNGVAAPLIYTSSGVIAAIVPFQTAGAGVVRVEVSFDGQNSAGQVYTVAPSAPGIFTDSASGIGEGAILNEDASLNSTGNPAAPGSVISVYGTGGGVTNPPDQTGAIAEGSNRLAASATATVGGQSAQVVYAGDAPGEVAGVVQFNIQVPNNVVGTVPVVITVGGNSSQATATVAITGAATPPGSSVSRSRRVSRIP
jgi:uncharacterized protein (TIGR03437 family)